MHTQTALSDLSLAGPSNDYHQLPVSHKQLRFARAIAARASLDLPAEAQQDRRSLSAWIDAQLAKQGPAQGPAQGSARAFSRYASSKQVAFAERIARIKRRQVPHECFRDMGLMSAWIDSNR